MTDEERATLERINAAFDATNHENPTVAPLRFEEWILYAAHLPREDDIVGRNPVSPYQVMELERNAARSENKALTLQLQQLQQQANTVIRQLQQQLQMNTTFFGAIVHAAGGSLSIPHTSLDAVRTTAYRLDEKVDNDAKATVLTITEVKQEEAPADPAPAAPTPREQEESVPTTRPVIELVSR